jgi:hypothetical protein
VVRVHRGSPFHVWRTLAVVVEKKVKVNYHGSIPWLIFWVLIFFPVALVLLATSGRFNLDGKFYHIKYDGSRGWLCFWVIVMFPVAILLLLLNGVALIAEENSYA